MKMDLKDILSAIGRIPTLVNGLLQQANLPAQRAPLVAQALRSVWPSSPLYACRLLEGSQAHLEVLDAAGTARPEWAEKLEKEMARAEHSGMLLSPGSIVVQRLPITSK